MKHRETFRPWLLLRWGYRDSAFVPLDLLGMPLMGSRIELYVCNARSVAFEPRDHLYIPSLIGEVSSYSMLTHLCFGGRSNLRNGL